MVPDVLLEGFNHAYEIIQRHDVIYSRSCQAIRSATGSSQPTALRALATSPMGVR